MSPGAGWVQIDLSPDECKALTSALRREIRHCERGRESMLERLGDDAPTDRADEWLGWLRSAYCRRGSLAYCDRIDTTWFAWPRGLHSEKPDAFLDIVERVSPGPYVELFARAPRLGWDSWGFGYESAPEA